MQPLSRRLSLAGWSPLSHSTPRFPAQSSEAVWKSRWSSWASVPNIVINVRFFVDVKQHSNHRLMIVMIFMTQNNF